MASEGSEQAWPSCNPFHCKCDGGDNGELDEDQRVHLEWTCFHGIEGCDMNPEICLFKIGIRGPKGRESSFDEWFKRRFGTTNIDKKTKLKVFVEWMIDSYSEESDAPEEYDDPFERSFEKFKSEFEIEVLQLLDDYGLKIGVKGYMLQDVWEKCERTFKRG
ncbi:hypothetical protein CTI12_AA397670 [Artemisia annua]|uniref:Uncharacterized protein n=1 Tax=Artemisia annua TaxID=35608 RepID=A0A2U1MB97_ARTAN|nr:hypothetical protein CTI12_AA397670 [Artemisia annua]